MVFSRASRLDFRSHAGSGKDLPADAAPASRRGALLRSAAQSGRCTGRRTSAGACGKASEGAGYVLQADGRRAAGGQDHPVRTERVSCAGGPSEPQGASCAARGAGARRGAQKPRWTRARLGAVAERASELRFIPGGKRRDSPLSCRRRACRRRARLDTGAGREFKPRLGKG